MHWYKRDPNAALAGMAELTLQECGAYNRILDLIYSREGVLPDDDKMLIRVLGCHGNEWRAVKRKLIEKGKIWITPEGNILAKRVEKTLKEAAFFSETQRKRVGKRWEKQKNASDNNDPTIPLPVIPIQPQPQPQPQRKRKRAAVEEPPEFLDFWKSIPNRGDQQHNRYTALKAYLGAVEEGANVFQINAAAKRWYREHLDTRDADRKYIPQASRWLNEKRFLDYHVKQEQESNLEYDSDTKMWRWKAGHEPQKSEN